VDDGMTIRLQGKGEAAAEAGSGDLYIVLNVSPHKKFTREGDLILSEETISMIDAAALDMVDMVCREVRQSAEPFGGIQVVLVGDFFQLPPIVRMNTEARDEFNQEVLFDQKPVARFACDAPAWERARPIVCYLTEQHRQDDADFLNLLSALRNNIFNETHLKHIEKRKIKQADAPENIPKLFSHNIDVDWVNDKTLEKITGASKTFEMTSRGPAHTTATLQRF
jgi:hypothetical protein